MTQLHNSIQYMHGDPASLLGRVYAKGPPGGVNKTLYTITANRL